MTTCGTAGYRSYMYMVLICFFYNLLGTLTQAQAFECVQWCRYVVSSRTFYGLWYDENTFAAELGIINRYVPSPLTENTAGFDVRFFRQYCMEKAAVEYSDSNSVLLILCYYILYRTVGTMIKSDTSFPQ